MNANDDKLFRTAAEGTQGMGKVPELNPLMEPHSHRAAKTPISREVRKEYNRRERLHKKGVGK